MVANPPQAARFACGTQRPEGFLLKPLQFLLARFIIRRGGPWRAEREAEVLAGLELGAVPSERAGDTRAFFLGRRSEVADRLVAAARARGVPLLLRNATLEDVYLKLTGRELNE